eukprot:jgi/Ulvmu1/1193/UM108_0021.1
MLRDFPPDLTNAEELAAAADAQDARQEYDIGVTEAIRAVVAAAAQAAEGLLAELPSLAAQRQRRGRPAPSRRLLQEQAARTVMSQGLGHMLTIREAPRILRRLDVRAVVPLIRFCELRTPPRHTAHCVLRAASGSCGQGS